MIQVLTCQHVMLYVLFLKNTFGTRKGTRFLSEFGLIFKIRFSSVEAECSDITKYCKWSKLKYLTITMGSWDRWTCNFSSFLNPVMFWCVSYNANVRFFSENGSNLELINWNIHCFCVFRDPKLSDRILPEAFIFALHPIFGSCPSVGR